MRGGGGGRGGGVEEKGKTESMERKIKVKFGNGIFEIG